MNIAVVDDEKAIRQQIHNLIKTSRADFLVTEFSSEAKKVEIHMAGKREAITVYATMEELERQLGEGFYRCHRGYLVNMAHIAGYDNDNIFLSDGEKVYPTKKKHGEFVKTYMLVSVCRGNQL